MTLGQRVQAIRNELGMSQEEMAERAGISANALRTIEQDRGNPTAATLTRLCSILNVSIDWLLGLSPVKQYDITVMRGSETIPLFSISALESISQVQAWKGAKNVEVLLRSGVENFAVRIENNSMFPDFKSGDVALVKLADSAEFDGQTCVVTFDCQTLLRKFYPKNGKILLKANNPDYKDMEIAALDWKSKGKIIGVVVGRIDYRQF
jgi:SOS-response transcriptional repressor LexA